MGKGFHVQGAGGNTGSPPKPDKSNTVGFPATNSHTNSGGHQPAPPLLPPTSKVDRAINVASIASSIAGIGLMVASMFPGGAKQQQQGDAGQAGQGGLLDNLAASLGVPPLMLVLCSMALCILCVCCCCMVMVLAMSGGKSGGGGSNLNAG